MVDPRYQALFDPERSRDDFSGGVDGQSPPPGATVWLFRWRITEAALGVLIEVGRPMTIGQILAYLESRGIRLAKADPPSWMLGERPDIRQIAMEWALRSGLWPSDS